MPVGLFFAWAGYTLAIWGYSKVKSAGGASPGLTLSDVALPSHRSTYVNAFTIYKSGNAGTAAVVPNSTGPNQVGLPAGSSTQSLAVAQAKKDVTSACNANPNSAACKQAKANLSLIVNPAPKAPTRTTIFGIPIP